VQLSRAFTRGVGSLVPNQLDLEKASLSHALAAAASSLKVVAGVVVRVTLMFGGGPLAGASILQLDLTVSPYLFAVPIAVRIIGYAAWRARDREPHE